MKILIIGGTRFVGRHLVEELIRRGHDLTMLNRGTYNIFPQLKTIIGDRNIQNDIARAASENWADKGSRRAVSSRMAVCKQDL